MEDIIIWKAVMTLPFPAFVIFSIWDSDTGLGDSALPGSIFSVLRLHIRGKATYARYLCFATRNVTFFGRELPAGRQQDNLRLSLLP